LALVVGGITAQAFDHPAGGIGFAVQGFAVVFFCGEGLLQIGDRALVIGLIAAVEAISELGDPAAFALQILSQLPEAGTAGPLGK
jgi:hypothetical protein